MISALNKVTLRGLRPNRFTLQAIVVTLGLFLNTAFAYTPPIGIPEPEFGIDQSHTMYNGATYAAGGFTYRDAGNGPYTHYIDNTASNCTDSGNTYGTAAQPRCSIPGGSNLTLDAGTVMEIHGGPYSVASTYNITGNGTSSAPVFLRGVSSGSNKPIITNGDRAEVSGTYFIIENLDFNGIMFRTGGSTSHMALRHSIVRNHPSKNGSMIGGSDIVFFDNEIHHNQGNDRHGTSVNSGAQRVWILESYYHHNGGDGIQLCHGCSANPPRFVYIGKNLFHSDRENGVDLKYVENIVISQNTMHSYKSAPANTNWCFDDGSGCGTFSSGSDGSAVVIGSDGAPVNPWILFNDIYGSVTGIRFEQVYGSWVIGNTIHDHSNRGLALEKNGEPLYIANNTFYNVQTGIDQYFRNFFQLYMDNNIFSNISGNYLNIESNEVADDSYLSNNIFWKNGSNIPLVWNTNRTITSAANINALSSGTSNIIADPMFVDAANGNFALRNGSPAIDTGNNVMDTYESQFRAIFGNTVSLKYDIAGRFRPQGVAGVTAKYDIGAHEASGDPVPMPPTGILVQ